MKQTGILQTFVLSVLLSAVVLVAGSCSDDDESAYIGFGTVTGTVTDQNGLPLQGVAVSVSDVDVSASTGSDGKYTLSNVPMEKRALVFRKTDYQTTSATIVAGKFDGNKVATIDVSMVEASAKIMGTVLDARNGNQPLAGVTVSVGNKSSVSGSDGTYIISELSIDNYTVSFAKADYTTITKTVGSSDFIDGIVTLNIRMGSLEILPGLTADDLSRADKWYYNEYRGGGNADAYPHWDWACDYMCTSTFVGAWEEQWEGTTLQIRNTTDMQRNPADLDMFDSYTYGSKKITDDNKVISLRVRTHNADASAPAYFGVQVVDLSAANPVAVKIGETKTHGSGDYTDYSFDLSAYIGKEVVIAVGIYRKETGDYWKQLVLRAIRFADVKVESWDWLPGTEVVDGWKMTYGMVRSTMPHLKKSFTGISPMSAGRDVNMNTGYPAAYRKWRDVSHIAHEWSFMPLHKDPEVFASEGYLIKTRGNSAINTKVPESYFYAKFPIEAGSNVLTLKTRNFSSDPTFFKLTAITEDGVVRYMSPDSNTAQEASAADDGCWKFKHQAGGAGDPENYASFVYNLSEFNGQNVLLVISVHNGELNGTENKLVFYSVNLN